MIIDCISDLHGCKPALQGGDLLIVAGDLTKSDKPIQYGEFAAWIQRQNYTKKILIAGNHDTYFENQGFEAIKDVYADIGVDYLCDSGTEFRYWPPLKPGMEDGTILDVKDYKIWGSPWSLWFYGVNPKCKAFMGSENVLRKKFDLIPNDTDILITHSPPYKFLDQAKRYDGTYENVGSAYLSARIFDMKPKLHVFGHIHEAYGETEVSGIHWPIPTKLVNCSHVNEHYEPVNKPVRIVL